MITKTINAHDPKDYGHYLCVTVKVNVCKDGIFTTTLKEEDVAMIDTYGVSLSMNRIGRRGYFESDTLQGIVEQIKEVLEACLSCEVINEVPVFKYYIDTACAYVFSDKGEIVPNGKREWVGEIFSEYGTNWRQGTTRIDASTGKGDFGLTFWVRPYLKKTVKYRDGSTKIFYEDYEGKPKSDVRFLHDLVCGFTASWGKTQKEMVITDKSAAFFVSLVKSICMLNESLGEILKQDKLEEFISSGRLIEMQ